MSLKAIKCKDISDWKRDVEGPRENKNNSMSLMIKALNMQKSSLINQPWACTDKRNKHFNYVIINMYHFKSKQHKRIERM